MGKRCLNRRGSSIVEAALMLPVIAVLFVFLIEMVFVFGAQVVLYGAASEAANTGMSLTRGFNPYSHDNTNAITTAGLQEICQVALDRLSLMRIDPEDVRIVVQDSVTSSFARQPCRIQKTSAPKRLGVRIEYTHTWLHRRMGLPGASDTVLSAEVFTRKQAFTGE